MSDADFKHFFGKARDAARGGVDAWASQSTGERVAVALALNRADWLALMNYTLAEAVARTGPEWCALLTRVERQLRADGLLTQDS